MFSATETDIVKGSVTCYIGGYLAKHFIEKFDYVNRLTTLIKNDATCSLIVETLLSLSSLQGMQVNYHTSKKTFTICLSVVENQRIHFLQKCSNNIFKKYEIDTCKRVLWMKVLYERLDTECKEHTCTLYTIMFWLNTFYIIRWK